MEGQLSRPSPQGKRQETGPSKETGENLFAGKVRIETTKGPIELDIHAARIIQGGELLERSRIEEEDKTPLDYRTALFELGRAIDDLTDTPKHPIYRGQVKVKERWRLRRTSYIQVDGEDSIFTLLPETHTKNQSIFTRVTHRLLHGGVRTKEDLTKKTLDELINGGGLGKKSIPLIIAMRNVAVAELAQKAQAPPQTQ